MKRLRKSLSAVWKRTKIQEAEMESEKKDEKKDAPTDEKKDASTDEKGGKS